jgi:hypothetical protein
MAREVIQYKVGIGKNVHMWLDNWHLDGVLYTSVSAKESRKKS